MIIRLSFLFAVFCSIISQIPSVLESSWGDLMKYSWIVPAILLVFVKPMKYLDKPIRAFSLFLLTFGLYCSINEASSVKQYLGRDFYNIVISFLIFAVSYKFWINFGGRKIMNAIAFAILVGGTLLSYYLYVDYLREGDLMSNIYAYKGKNSASMIIFCALLIPLLTMRLKQKWMYVFPIPAMLFMFYVVIILKSRATLLGVLFTIFYCIFKANNRKVVAISLVITITTVLVVLSNPELYEVVVDGIIFAGRDVDDINELSSGRFFQVGEAWSIFKQNMWFGDGNMYMDCMPLVVLAQYGIIGASIFFSFLIVVGMKIFRFDRKNRVHLASFLLYSIFMLNSLFEAQPPFGPGVKCFMLWMILGFSLAQINIASHQKHYYAVPKLNRRIYN